MRFVPLFFCAFWLVPASLSIGEEPAKPFTVVALPDTQCYCDTRHQQSARKWGNGDLRRYFLKQTEWVRDNKKRLNISFLVHEGDIVQTDYPEEWAIAREAMSRLDGVVPYCLCLGNHDIGYQKTDKDEYSFKSATNRSTHFNEYFPRDKFSKRPEFGGTHKPDEHDNSWYQFESAGLKFMILALECTPRDEVVQWANTVVRDHPEHRVIVLTHSYLNANNTRITTGFDTPGNSGEELWQKLVKKHQNIFMVLCGHAAGEGLLTSIGDHGNQVHQVLSDYQIMNNGGESWLRYMVFQPTENKIKVFTYNPAIDQYMEGSSSRFDLEYAMSAARVDRDAIKPLASRASYLLLDKRVVESQQNARLAVGTVTKSLSNPLFAEDRPWEVRFDNLYANIVYDEAEQIFKCWYSPFIRDVAKKPPMAEWNKVSYANELRKLKGASARRMGICYATSKDGIHWQKPNLGLVEFDGSTANNLVFGDAHGAGVFKDLTDPDARRRYKMITGGQPHGVLSSSFSADGLHWSELHPIAKVRGDTHNNAFWDPIGKKYVAISRENVDGNRTVVRLESDDFIDWSEAREILRGPKTAQTYAMPVTFYHGVFLGLIAVFDTDSDRVTTELAWSPDTVTWHRIDPGTPLIPLADRSGEYDWGCAYAAASPVIMPDGEIRIYYGASNGNHTSWRDGFLALATLRPDGWAGYEPIDPSVVASVRTSRLTCSGGALRITADAKGGDIRVKVIGNNDDVLATSSSVTDQVTNSPIRWSGDFDFSRLEGEAIRLEFTIQGGRLYSFSFDSKPPVPHRAAAAQ